MARVHKITDSAHEETVISTPDIGIALQRRKYYRVHEPLPFSFTVIEADDDNLIGKDVIDTEIKDLSVGGLAFETRLPLKTGDRLDMNLELSPSQVVNAVGSVLRVSQNEDLHSVSVTFFLMDLEDQQTLLLFLAESRLPDAT